jgi:hypothetical protein
MSVDDAMKDQPSNYFAVRWRLDLSAGSIQQQDVDINGTMLSMIGRALQSTPEVYKATPHPQLLYFRYRMNGSIHEVYRSDYYDICTYPGMGTFHHRSMAYCGGVFHYVLDPTFLPHPSLFENEYETAVSSSDESMVVTRYNAEEDEEDEAVATAAAAAAALGADDDEEEEELRNEDEWGDLYV